MRLQRAYAAQLIFLLLGCDYAVVEDTCQRQIIAAEVIATRRSSCQTAIAAGMRGPNGNPITVAECVNGLAGQGQLLVPVAKREGSGDGSLDAPAQ